MFDQVLAAFFQSHQVLVSVSLMERLARSYVWTTAMHFQRASSGDDNSSIRLETADATLDVAELFHTHVGTESTFSENIANTVRRISSFRSSELQRYTVSENGRVSVGDVSERSSVDEYRCTLMIK